MRVQIRNGGEVVVRTLRIEELTEERMKRFAGRRSGRYYSKNHGIWTIREDKRSDHGRCGEESLAYLQELVASGGTLLGVFEGEVLEGVCGVGSRVFGPGKEYLLLAPVLTAGNHPELAVFRELLEAAGKIGVEFGAHYLYIASNADVEEQLCWRLLGAREVAWYLPEQADCHIPLEYPIINTGDVQDVYTNCPVIRGGRMSMRLVEMSDAEALLRCYSDPSAQKLFNTDHCRDDFRYLTLAEMENAILFWMDAYEAKEFVRFALLDTWTSEVVGTVEIYHYMGEDSWKHRGVVRIDLRSDYENGECLSELLYLINRYAYDVFHVATLAMKAPAAAPQRIAALEQAGYRRTEELLLNRYGDYYIRECLHS